MRQIKKRLPMMTIDAQKKFLRSEINSRLKAMSADERKFLSTAAVEKFLLHPIYKSSKIIMAYSSTALEIQLGEFFLTALSHGKILAVPFIRGREMFAAELSSVDELEIGAYGILTVKNADDKIIDAKKIDCIVTPGLAFDANCNRLGKGGGYYDKFFVNAVNAKKIALAYDCQLVDKVPVEQHDMPVDVVITPTKIFYGD